MTDQGKQAIDKSEPKTQAISDIIAIIAGVAVAYYHGGFWGMCVFYMLKSSGDIKNVHIWPKTIFFTTLIILAAWVTVNNGV